jgi:hypothetical protein
MLWWVWCNVRSLPPTQSVVQCAQPTFVLSMAASNAHLKIWCCMQELCINSSESQCMLSWCAQLIPEEKYAKCGVMCAQLSFVHDVVWCGVQLTFEPGLTIASLCAIVVCVTAGLFMAER